MKNKTLQSKNAVADKKFKELNVSDMDILRGGALTFGREKLKGTDN